jgi:hypothetical protein
MSFAQVQTLDVLCRHHIHTLSLTSIRMRCCGPLGLPYIYNRIDPFRAARLRLLITHTRTFLPLVVVYPMQYRPVRQVTMLCKCTPRKSCRHRRREMVTFFRPPPPGPRARPAVMALRYFTRALFLQPHKMNFLFTFARIFCWRAPLCSECTKSRPRKS